MDKTSDTTIIVINGQSLTLKDLSGEDLVLLVREHKGDLVGIAALRELIGRNADKRNSLSQTNLDVQPANVQSNED